MKTQQNTIASMICELIETHMNKCDSEFPGTSPDHVPHVLSEVHGTKADIVKMSNADLGADTLIHMELSDGSEFDIHVSEA